MSAPGIVPVATPYPLSLPWGPGQIIQGQVTGFRRLNLPAQGASGPVDAQGQPYVRDVVLQVRTDQGVLETWVANQDLLLINEARQVTARRPLAAHEREALRTFYQDVVLIELGGFPRPADLALTLSPAPELPPARLAAAPSPVAAPLPADRRW